MTEQYGIMDDDGVIYQGDEQFVTDKWEEYVNGTIEGTWKGDLVLFKILGTFR